MPTLNWRLELREAGFNEDINYTEKIKRGERLRKEKAEIIEETYLYKKIMDMFFYLCDKKSYIAKGKISDVQIKHIEQEIYYELTNDDKETIKKNVKTKFDEEKKPNEEKKDAADNCNKNLTFFESNRDTMLLTNFGKDTEEKERTTKFGKDTEEKERTRMANYTKGSKGRSEFWGKKKYEEYRKFSIMLNNIVKEVQPYIINDDTESSLKNIFKETLDKKRKVEGKMEKDYTKEIKKLWKKFTSTRKKLEKIISHKDHLNLESVLEQAKEEIGWDFKEFKIRCSAQNDIEYIDENLQQLYKNYMAMIKIIHVCMRLEITEKIEQLTQWKQGIQENKRNQNRGEEEINRVMYFLSPKDKTTYYNIDELLNDNKKSNYNRRLLDMITSMVNGDESTRIFDFKTVAEDPVPIFMYNKSTGRDTPDELFKNLSENNQINNQWTKRVYTFDNTFEKGRIQIYNLYNTKLHQGGYLNIELDIKEGTVTKSEWKTYAWQNPQNWSKEEDRSFLIDEEGHNGYGIAYIKKQGKELKMEDNAGFQRMKTLFRGLKSGLGARFVPSIASDKGSNYDERNQALKIIKGPSIAMGTEKNNKLYREKLPLPKNWGQIQFFSINKNKYGSMKSNSYNNEAKTIKPKDWMDWPDWLKREDNGNRNEQKKIQKNLEQKYDEFLKLDSPNNADNSGSAGLFHNETILYAQPVERHYSPMERATYGMDKIVLGDVTFKF